MGKCYLLTGLMILAFAVSAGADFREVRSIPIPDGPGSLTGLDSRGDTLFAVAQQGDCSSYCSYMYLLDPSDGDVLMERYYLNFQPDCSLDPSLLLSGACCEEATYWVGDECGDVVKVRWTPDSLTVLESFLMPHGGALCHNQPAGLAYAWPWLFILDPDAWAIQTYDDYYDYLGDQIWLPDGIRIPNSITFYGDNFLISSAMTDSLYEVNSEGDLVETHWLDGFGDRTAVGLAFVGGQLYVASRYDSILVFEESSYEEPVPPGDNVVVEIVPGGVTVTFDSVSTGGTMTGAVFPSDSCPPPEGVSFFDVFTEITTDANFDYAAEVELATQGDLPPGVDPDLVRVFVRPSGPCGDPGYRDITTMPEPPPGAQGRDFSSITRTKSEDYEFSVFALAEDHRPPAAVVEIKFNRLEAAIDAGQDTIPPGVLSQINSLLDHARAAYCRGLAGDAALLADSIATIVRATPAIPHTYQPDQAGSNLAGQLIAEAHTLAFSLRFSGDGAKPTSGKVTPTNLTFAYDGFVRACLEIPAGLAGTEINQQCVYFEHSARAIPESVQLMDCDGDGQPEIRAMFRCSDVKAALGHPGESIARITCVVGEFQAYADVVVRFLERAEGSANEPGHLANELPAPPLAESDGLGRDSAVFRISPNPSKSSFAVELARNGEVPVEVVVYSVTGEVVKVLHRQAPSSDRLSLVWNADNAEGQRVSPGAYFVVVREGEKAMIKKVVLQR